MQTRKEPCEVLGGLYLFKADLPLTAEDYDLMTGQLGSCLADALKQTVPRQFYGRIRGAICDALHEKGGDFIRRSEKKDDKELWETELDYVKRLVAAGTITKADLQTLGDEVTASITYQSSLVGGGNTRSAVGKKFMDKAQEAIEAWEKGVNSLGQPASVEKTLAAIRELIPGAALADPTSVEEVARLFRDYDAAFQKKMASAVI